MNSKNGERNISSDVEIQMITMILYIKIEKNPIQLAIKTDDFDSFQNFLINSNSVINEEINELILEIFNQYYSKFSLINFAIEYSAMKIFK